MENHIQLFGSAKSRNLNEASPVVSLSTLFSTISPSLGTSEDKGTIWFALGLLENCIPGGNGSADGEEELTLILEVAPLEEANDRSHRKKWRVIGTLAWRCNESFWLREMVSKHLTAPVVETIQGRTFWLDTLEITNRLDALAASLYRLLRPDRVEAALSSPSMTEEM